MNIQYTSRTRLQSLPEWNSTGVMIAYDDSDGSTGVAQDLCGYGHHVPMLAISSYTMTTSSTIG